MSIGLGIFLIVLGAIIEWVIQVNVPFIDRQLLGWILMGAGAVVTVLAIIFGSLRGRASTTTTTRDAAGNAQISEVETRRTDVE